MPHGLDVKILSPPHSLLAAGMYGVVVGAVLLAAADRNRAAASGARGVPSWLVVAALGIQWPSPPFLITEVSYPNDQHTRLFYYASAAMYPRSCWRRRVFAHPLGGDPGGLGVSAGVGMMVWLLPLFPGRAETRADLQSGDPPGAAAVSAPVGGAGAGH